MAILFQYQGLAEPLFQEIPTLDKWFKELSVPVRRVPTPVNTTYNFLVEFNVLPVVTDFIGSITVGLVPLLVNFTDESIGSPNTWLWEFGIGEGTSVLQNPSHIYTTIGVFTVKLTASIGGNSDEEEKINYITTKTNIIKRPIKLYSGVKEKHPKDGWENEKYFFVEQSDPYSCIVQYWDLFVDTTNE